MRSALVLFFVLSFGTCLAAENSAPATNVCVRAESVTFSTNAPTAKLTRQQCEAITKSGAQCKRNAAAGEKMCWQHIRSVRRAAEAKTPQERSYNK